MLRVKYLRRVHREADLEVLYRPQQVHLIESGLVYLYERVVLAVRIGGHQGKRQIKVAVKHVHLQRVLQARYAVLKGLIFQLKALHQRADIEYDGVDLARVWRGALPSYLQPVVAYLIKGVRMRYARQQGQERDCCQNKSRFHAKKSQKTSKKCIRKTEYGPEPPGRVQAAFCASWRVFVPGRLPGPAGARRSQTPARCLRRGRGGTVAWGASRPAPAHRGIDSDGRHGMRTPSPACWRRRRARQTGMVGYVDGTLFSKVGWLFALDGAVLFVHLRLEEERVPECRF